MSAPGLLAEVPSGVYCRRVPCFPVASCCACASHAGYTATAPFIRTTLPSGETVSVNAPPVGEEKEERGRGDNAHFRLAGCLNPIDTILRRTASRHAARKSPLGSRQCPGLCPCRVLFLAGCCGFRLDRSHNKSEQRWSGLDSILSAYDALVPLVRAHRESGCSMDPDCSLDRLACRNRCQHGRDIPNGLPHAAHAGPIHELA